MGLRLNHMSASSAITDGQSRHALLFSGSAYFAPGEDLEGGSALRDATGFGDHSDAAYIFSGTIGGNDKTVFLGDVTVSGTLGLGDGSTFANAADGMTAGRVSYFADSDTLSGSLDFLFNATGSDAGDQGLMLGEQTGTTAVFFRDEQIKLFSSVDGQLDIDADAEVEIGSAKIDINASSDFNIKGEAASTIEVATGGADADDLTITVTGGGDSSLLLTSTGTGTDAIGLSASSGGVDIDAAAAKDVNIAGGQVALVSKDDAASAISLTANQGTSETIVVTNTQGTAAGAISLQANAGGVDIDAAAAKDVSIAGGQVALVSKDNAAGAISLTANVGTSETITILNDQGEGEGAISITSTAGGVDIDAAAAKDVDIAGGQVAISSKDNAASAISLTTNQGSTETIVVTNTQGTDAGAITLTATAGGVDIDAASTVTIDSSGGTLNIGRNNNNQQINIGTNGDRTIVIGKSGGATTTQIHSDGGNLVLDAGASGKVAVTGDVEVSRHLVVAGDFTVSGDTTLVNTTNLEVEDALIALNFNSGSSSGPARDSGLVIGNGGHGSLNRVFMWDNSDSEFAFVSSFTAPSGSAAITVKDYQNIKVADVEATGSVTVGGLTEKRVLFAGANGVISDDAGMTYESSTNELFVSGAVQVAQLQIDNINNTLDLIDPGHGEAGLLTLNGALGLTGSTTSGGIKLSSAGRMQLGAVGKQIHASNVEAVPQISQIFNTNFGAGFCNTFQIYEPSESEMSDLFQIQVFDDGVTNITTTDAGGDNDGHLNLSADGQLNLDGVGPASLNSSGGVINVGHDTVDQDINIGTSGVREVTIGAGSADDNAGLTLRANKGGIDIDCSRSTGVLSLDTAGGAIEIGVNAAAGAINIGTNETARTVTVGNAIGATSLVLTSGTGDIIASSTDAVTIDGAGVVELNSSGGAISIGNDNVNQQINVGTNGDRTIIIGKSGGSTTTQIHSDGGDLVLDAGSQNISTTGDLVPTDDNAHDLGSPTARFRNIYTGDLHLANERGNWTLVEESNMLTFRNNLSGKWYRMVMEEIDPSGRDAGMNGAAPMGSEGNPAGDPDWDL